MVFDVILNFYKDSILENINKNLAEHDVSKFDNDYIQDLALKELAKALCVAVYRNGKIEDVHAGDGCGD